MYQIHKHNSNTLYQEYEQNRERKKKKYQIHKHNPQLLGELNKREKDRTKEE